MTYHFVSFLLVPSLSEKDLKTRFRFHGLENLEKAKQERKGVLLLSCHMGNPDLALNGLALAGERVWLISKKFSVGFFNEIWFRLRYRSGLVFIPAHGRETAYQIFKALSLNDSVVFVIDQFMGPPYGIESRFFGKKTGTAYGLARFFIKSKAPIVTCHATEDETGRCHIHFGEPIFATEDILNRPGETQEQQNLRLVELFNSRVEKMILSAPRHWMWIHRRWKRWRA
jgi:KDO2-lipid IV(A) lauroyltransferase